MCGHGSTVSSSIFIQHRGRSSCIQSKGSLAPREGRARTPRQERSAPSAVKLERNQSRYTRGQSRRVAFSSRKSHLLCSSLGHCYSGSALTWKLAQECVPRFEDFDEHRVYSHRNAAAHNPSLPRRPRHGRERSLAAACVVRSGTLRQRVDEASRCEHPPRRAGRRARCAESRIRRRAGHAGQHREAARGRSRHRYGPAGRALRRASAHAAQGCHGHCPRQTGDHGDWRRTCSHLLARNGRSRPRRG